MCVFFSIFQHMFKLNLKKKTSHCWVGLSLITRKWMLLPCINVCLFGSGQRVRRREREEDEGGGGGGIPVEEDRMDGWLDRTPQRGGREKGKMVGVEGTQDGDKEWMGNCVCVCARANGNILYNFYGLGTSPHPRPQSLKHTHTHTDWDCGSTGKKPTNIFIVFFFLIICGGLHCMCLSVCLLQKANTFCQNI